MSQDSPTNPQSPVDADPRDPYNVTQASRIYLLPNLMTAGNLFCGFSSLISCIFARFAEYGADGLYNGYSSYDYYRFAVFLILGAAVFDSLDGRLARMGGRESLFGAEFDSLADVVSFGIAPAMMVFFFILSPTQGIPWFRSIGWAVGFIYLLCAAMRLARFNVITNPLLHRGAKDSNKDFIGLPVPTAAATVAATLLCLMRLTESEKSLKVISLGLPVLMLLVAFLMMSTIRFPSGKNLGMQTRIRVRYFIILLIVVGFVIYYREFAFLGLCVAFLLFGILRHIKRKIFGHKTAPAAADSNKRTTV
ncbi:CDP-diacylglycerol--serine O-phosphatidyltransferase [Ereboglobus luteus]|uniref:CDP-diacylglycerol--serine O-phosphatidyltransferase n=1 Tax=Ereboglobus luteus TaxID=1796921 RepID=A0A2U8E1E9_9BACT|nr:CDP-diacylglycerol--serine O-phosphatidyltransferase [Ereboglobus luteus]AWI08698.1 CDP-diacylglycerol--serine O-phosphatidyltransferase [Ereboglobus luteus]